MPTLMLGGHGRIVIIDGFCGPGEYSSGEDGSPIIALRTYLDHSHRDKLIGELVFLFIDSHRKRTRYLEEVALPKLGPLPPNVKVQILCGRFDESVGELRMQTELLNCKKWMIRVELANASFEYLEVFHNRTRRDSSLGMLTPVEFEKLHAEATDVASSDLLPLIGHHDPRLTRATLVTRRITPATDTILGAS